MTETQNEGLFNSSQSPSVRFPPKADISSGSGVRMFRVGTRLGAHPAPRGAWQRARERVFRRRSHRGCAHSCATAV